MLDQLNSLIDWEDFRQTLATIRNNKRQKDTDARWTKKRNVSHFGDENHVNVDVRPI